MKRFSVQWWEQRLQRDTAQAIRGFLDRFRAPWIADREALRNVKVPASFTFRPGAGREAPSNQFDLESVRGGG